MGEILIKQDYVFEEKVAPKDDLDLDVEDKARISLPSDNLKEDSLDSDVDDLDECNINEVVAGYDAKDEARICPFTNRSGGCFKRENCRLEHRRLSRDGITTDKVLTINRAKTQFVLPPVGDMFEILVTGYINTCHFYAQILDDGSG